MAVWVCARESPGPGGSSSPGRHAGGGRRAGSCGSPRMGSGRDPCSLSEPGCPVHHSHTPGWPAPPGRLRAYPPGGRVADGAAPRSAPPWGGIAGAPSPVPLSGVPLSGCVLHLDEQGRVTDHSRGRPQGAPDGQGWACPRYCAGVSSHHQTSGCQPGQSPMRGSRSGNFSSAAWAMRATFHW